MNKKKNTLLLYTYINLNLFEKFSEKPFLETFYKNLSITIKAFQIQNIISEKIT